ncbi:hypothetical protein GGU11DRAFT_679152, partial [Lentinula aff. detonsa]
MERTAGVLSPRAKRRTVRYNTSPSPLKKTGSAIKSVSKSLRRASLRVVNLGNNALENQIRLPDEDNEKLEENTEDEPLPDLSARLPIRGRTLCVLGPRNKLRLWLYNWLIYPWTEPTILLLIIVNAVVLTIQASHSLTLPDGANVGDALPLHVTGYFHAWEDYALFVLFVIFTLEAFARICVSGFLLDPEISASTFFTSPFASTHDISIPSQSSSSSNNLPRQLTLSTDVGGPLSRGLSITERFNRLNRNIKRPF